MAVVTVGQIVNASKSKDILGIQNRAQILDYLVRAIEIAAYKGNFDPWLKNLDVCADASGCVVLPSFVGTVLSVNIGGRPSIFRNQWYQFHINGTGSTG